MVVAARPKTVTVDELAVMPDGDRYELVHGHLVEREMSPESAYVAGEIFGNFRDYLKTNPIAIAFTDGTGFTLQPGIMDLLRKPDAVIVLKTNLPTGKIPDTRFEFSPDLAVEALSPSDVWYEVEAKIREYLNAGTKVVWLANPPRQRITAYFPDGTDVTFGPNDEITAEEILPSFRMKVRDVFP